ncbi:MAG: hypothetical protein ACK4PR_11770, partial [Gammaproteobacteria bacterium]
WSVLYCMSQLKTSEQQAFFWQNTKTHSVAFINAFRDASRYDKNNLVATFAAAEGNIPFSEVCKQTNDNKLKTGYEPHQIEQWLDNDNKKHLARLIAEFESIKSKIEYNKTDSTQIGTPASPAMNRSRQTSAPATPEHLNYTNLGYHTPRATSENGTSPLKHITPYALIELRSALLQIFVDFDKNIGSPFWGEHPNKTIIIPILKFAYENRLKLEEKSENDLMFIQRLETKLNTFKTKITSLNQPIVLEGLSAVFKEYIEKHTKFYQTSDKDNSIEIINKQEENDERASCMSITNFHEVHDDTDLKVIRDDQPAKNLRNIFSSKMVTMYETFLQQTNANFSNLIVKTLDKKFNDNKIIIEKTNQCSIEPKGSAKKELYSIAKIRYKFLVTHTRDIINGRPAEHCYQATQPDDSKSPYVCKFHLTFIMRPNEISDIKFDCRIAKNLPHAIKQKINKVLNSITRKDISDIFDFIVEEDNMSPPFLNGSRSTNNLAKAKSVNNVSRIYSGTPLQQPSSAPVKKTKVENNLNGSEAGKDKKPPVSRNLFT